MIEQKGETTMTLNERGWRKEGGSVLDGYDSKACKRALERKTV